MFVDKQFMDTFYQQARDVKTELAGINAEIARIDKMQGLQGQTHAQTQQKMQDILSSFIKHNEEGVNKYSEIDKSLRSLSNEVTAIAPFMKEYPATKRKVNQLFVAGGVFVTLIVALGALISWLLGVIVEIQKIT